MTRSKAPHPKEWRDRCKAFAWKGHHIYYRDEGEGEPLLCLHGFPTCSMDWWPIWEELKGHYRIIAPDFIGFGFSDKPTRYAYSLFDQTDMAEALCRHLEIERVHVLAHDYGDSVALELAARFGERRVAGDPGLFIASVCLLNGGIFMHVARPRKIQMRLKGPLGFLYARLMNRKAFGEGFRRIFGKKTPPSERELDAWWEAITYKKGRRVIHKLIHYIDERLANQDRWTTVMADPPLPIRLVIGTQDPVSGEHIAAHYETVAPLPDVVRLDCGHYPQTEMPEAVWSAYRDFREKITSPRA
jgi:pimeloyl-ACP methyl ester carboxylesterase